MIEDPVPPNRPTGPDAEELFARARALSVDLLKLGLTLSTGVVAGLAALLTQEKAPTFTINQKGALAAAAVLMLVSIGTGLVGWGANAFFYTNWAFSVLLNEGSGGPWANRRHRYRRLRVWLLSLSALFFFLGIVASAVFLFMRLYEVPIPALKQTGPRVQYRKEMVLSPTIERTETALSRSSAAHL